MTADASDSSLTTNPIPIPTALHGLSGSYWVTHCLNVTVAPDTYIRNIKYYQTWDDGSCADWDLSGSGWANPSRLRPGLYIGISSQTVAAAQALASGGEGFQGSYNPQWASSVLVKRMYRGPTLFPDHLRE